MLAQAFMLLCALAVLACSASIVRVQQLWWNLAGLLPGLLIFLPHGLVPGLPLQAEPSQIALLLFFLALAWIVRGVPVGLQLFCAGLMSGVWLQNLMMQAWPLPLALLLVAASLALALGCSLRHPGFRSPALQREAYLLLAAAGLALALLPELLRGWEQALVLQSVGEGEEAQDGATRALWASVLFVVLGMGRAAWKYRYNKK